MFYKNERWWKEWVNATRPGAPKKADKTWWYLGPIPFPPHR